MAVNALFLSMLVASDISFASAMRMQENKDAFEEQGKQEASEDWSLHRHCIAANGGECWESPWPALRLKTMCGLSGGNGYEVKEGHCKGAGFHCKNNALDQVEGWEKLIFTGLNFYTAAASDGQCRRESQWSNENQKEVLCCTEGIFKAKKQNDTAIECACDCDEHSEAACKDEHETFLQNFGYALMTATGNITEDLPKFMWLFHPDAVYVHTGLPTAKGHDALMSLFSSNKIWGRFAAESNPLLDVTTARLDGNSWAQAIIITRGCEESDGKDCRSVRDSIFVVDGKIKTMMTTLASPKDPEPPVQVDRKLLENLPKSTLSEKEAEVVKIAVDVYFNGFVALDPEAMQSAYWENPLYMFDFNAERKTPFGCFSSEDCATAPYFNSRDDLLPAFQGFCNGYINLNHVFESVEIYGAMALVTTVSFGCEGDNVTPNGSAPMPNREMFVLVRKDSTWKIHSYMFTFDPKSPIEPPVETCPPQQKYVGVAFANFNTSDCSGEPMYTVYSTGKPCEDLVPGLNIYGNFGCADVKAGSVTTCMEDNTCSTCKKGNVTTDGSCGPDPNSDGIWLKWSCTPDHK